jgi:hypothetical protein
MSGETLHYKKHLSLQIGQYCQVHEEDAPRNSQLSCTKGAIFLGPSGNVQGGYKFMSLHSMKKIVRRSWDAIPMPDTVIARVNQLSKDEPEQFVFTDHNGRVIGDIELPGVDGDGNHTPQDLLHNEAENIDLEIAPNNETEEEEVPSEPTPRIPHIEVETVNDAEEIDVEPALTPVAPAPAVPEPTADPEQIPGVRRSTRVRFPMKPGCTASMSGSSKYAYAVMQLESQGALHPDAHMFFNQNTHQAEPDVVAMIMTQLSLKAGLRQWGDKAKAAAHSEMKQLHLRDTFKPFHWSELTHDEKQRVLESHMFLKEKRDLKIKGRTVARGNKQCDYISKEEASSPAVAT